MIYLKYDRVDNSDRVLLHAAARKLLKSLLYDAFGTENADEKIEIKKGGKPYIKNAAFDFSDTHTAGAVAVAVCGKGRYNGYIISPYENCKKIGVDIELKDRNISEQSVLRISQKLFTKKEKDYLFCQSVGTKERFLEVWTKKESFVKATGEGLAGISRADTNGKNIKFCETKYVDIGGKIYIISVVGI